MNTVNIKELSIEQLIERVQTLEKKLFEKKDGRKNRPKKTREELDELARQRRSRREELEKTWELRRSAHLNKERFEHFMQRPDWMSNLNEEKTKHVKDLIREYLDREREWHNAYMNKRLNATDKLLRAAKERGVDSDEYEMAADDLAAINCKENEDRDNRYFSILMFSWTISGYKRLLGDSSLVSRLN